MKPLYYIIFLLLALAVSDYAISAYYEVEDFDFSYVESFERTVVEEPPVEQFEIITAEVSAYTSRVEECSGDPCISASGIDICLEQRIMDDIYSNRHNPNYIVVNPIKANGIVACPKKYPFGTIVGIVKTLEGGLSYYDPYVCVDRMAKRYQDGNYFDIYMGQGEEAYDRAMKWGRQTLEVKIYKQTTKL